MQLMGKKLYQLRDLVSLILRWTIMLYFEIDYIMQYISGQVNQLPSCLTLSSIIGLCNMSQRKL